MLTCRSPMASRSADWTLAGARLISSASTRLAKTGPSSVSKVSVEGRHTRVPTMSPGIRSGVNCRRWKLPPVTSARVRTASVLATPGTPSSSRCPRASRAIEHPLDHRVLPDQHPLDLEERPLQQGGAAVGRRGVDLRRGCPARPASPGAGCRRWSSVDPRIHSSRISTVHQSDKMGKGAQILGRARPACELRRRRDRRPRQRRRCLRPCGWRQIGDCEAEGPEDGDRCGEGAELRCHGDEDDHRAPGSDVPDPAAEGVVRRTTTEMARMLRPRTPIPDSPSSV